MMQMEMRLKPNYFRVSWNRREIRQKTEEHKVRFLFLYEKLNIIQWFLFKLHHVSTVH